MKEVSKEVIVRFDKVSKAYGKVMALRQLSFEVYRGEILAFLGPNGAGKSTTLQCLMGLKKPTFGQIQIFGESPQDRLVRQKVGVTPQDLDFPPQLKVKEILNMVGRAYHSSVDQEIVMKLELSSLLERRTHGMSGGERRRLGLACAVLSSPELLVLDEPTTGLDVESRRLLWDVIQLIQKKGTTILLTTHYLEEVEKLAHRVIVIDQGTNLFQGSVAEIKASVDYRKVEFQSDVTELPSEIVFDAKEKRGDQWTLWSRLSDDTVRGLVSSQLPYEHLTVTGASLEEAFVQLRKGKRV